MQREAIRQRIHYLLEHGGVHEREPPSRQHKATLWLLGFIALTQVVLLFHLLR
jgi:hypothetical protein